MNASLLVQGDVLVLRNAQAVVEAEAADAVALVQQNVVGLHLAVASEIRSTANWQRSSPKCHSSRSSGCCSRGFAGRR